MVLSTLLVLGIVFYTLYKWAVANNGFFVAKGVKFIKPYPFLGSNFSIFTRKLAVTDVLMEFYNLFPEEKIFGFFEFRKPIFMIRDPEVLKTITIKDFDHFTDHRQLFNSEADPLFNNSLGALTGNKWKDMRSAVSPVFTGSKMRQMFEFVSNCGANMAQTLRQSERHTYDMKQLFTCFTNDVIATSAFGIEVNSFEDADNEFFQLGQKILNFQSIGTTFKFLGYTLTPWLMKMLKINLFDSTATKYFRKLISDNFQIREEKNIVRNDLIHLLLQLKRGKALTTTEEDKLANGFEIGQKNVSRTWSDDELMAQCFVFFVAGFDTASVLLHFVAYELALDVEIQQKLFVEIQATNNQLNGQNLTYDALQKMNYMDMVVSEGLRKWPPVVVGDRLCTKDYILNVDGNGINIDKGQVLWIPTYAFHHDHKLFPNPEKFDPERFNDDNKHKINNGAYIPFGIGPRNCIGSRFALMESKAVLYYLLLNFSLEINPKTQIPLKIKKGPVGFLTESGVHLDFQLRK